jgi:hypothetical protein
MPARRHLVPQPFKEDEGEGSVPAELKHVIALTKPLPASSTKLRAGREEGGVKSEEAVRDVARERCEEAAEHALHALCFDDSRHRLFATTHHTPHNRTSTPHKHKTLHRECTYVCIRMENNRVYAHTEPMSLTCQSTY